jgi:competence protein ComEC
MDANAQSVVVLVRFGEFEALLTGDATSEVEEALLGDLPTTLEVLKVGHHGSITSTSDALLLHTTPALAVISVGANNRYGHPDDRVIARLLMVGSRIFRTDRNGHVRVRARRSGLHEVVGAW